jgi:hypothetical protein
MTGGVVVGFPHNGSTHALFATSLAGLVEFELRKPSPHYTYIACSAMGSCHIVSNRNRLVSKMGEAEWLLQLDTDLEFKPDLLRVMMDEARAVGAKVMLGLYLNTRAINEGANAGFYEPIPMLHSWTATGDGLYAGGFKTLPEIPPGQTFKVDGGGAGLLLVHREVFQAIGKNYEGRRWRHFAWQDLPDGDEMGEDLVFCRRAVEAGYEVWATTKVLARHWKSLPVTVPEWWQGRPLGE